MILKEDDIFLTVVEVLQISNSAHKTYVYRIGGGGYTLFELPADDLKSPPVQSQAPRCLRHFKVPLCLNMCWLIGKAPDFWGRSSGFESGNSHNDLGALQDHCIILYSKISG